ncbi:lysoplasmalogenase family protein, partial [Xenorhabdus bovienii]|uniref:lysoplasmalogenase family protein n=1 Tax=Xenorhabdus bovienii TaxID=40576 RepID=UPI0030BA0620
MIAGLLTALLSDAIRMLPSKYLLFSFITLFLSYLLYTISFALHMGFSFFFPLPLILLAVGIADILVVWTRLDNMRWRIIDSFIMALL